jgi:hypothetical protein
MSIPPPPPPADAFDATGRVAVDTTCVRCGYNLRTLLSDGVCPECGEAVTASIQEFFLHFAPPVWVRDLARGLRLLLIGLGGLIILPVVVGAIVGLTAFFNLTSTLAGPSWLLHVSGLIQFLTQVVGQVVLIVGLVWLTRPEPRRPQHSEGCTARRILRLCCWLLPIPAVGNLVLVFSLPTFPSLTPGAPPPPGLVGPWVASFALLAAAVGIAALGIYTTATLAVLRHLATLLRRIPRPGLVRGARVAFWGLLCCTGLLLIGYGVVLLTVLPKLPGVLAAASAAGTTSAPAMAIMPSGGPARFSWQYTATLPAAESENPAETQAVTNTPASAPATMPALPLPGPSFMVGMIFGACGGGVGGCGTLIFAIIAIIVLIRACGALFVAARAADAVTGG